MTGSKVVDTTKKPELQGHVREYVLKGPEVHTDALKSYEGLNDEYTHNVIEHAECLDSNPKCNSAKKGVGKEEVGFWGR